jgi:hypothetical protein
MKMKLTNLLTLTLIAAATGCHSPRPPPLQGNWTREDLVGYQYLLDTSTGVRKLTFWDEGYGELLASGWVWSQPYHWELTSSRTLEFYGESATPFDEWVRFEARTNTVLIVYRTGKTNTCTRLRFQATKE